MTELYSKKRVKFRNKNKQKEFFISIEKALGIKLIKNITKKFNLNIRQISYWRNAENTLPLDIFETLLNLSKVQNPDGIRTIDRYSHVKSAGRKGYDAVLKKYGKFPNDEKKQKTNWKKWWGKIGKYQDREIFRRKPITLPNKNKDLSELFGILIGDGGITERQVRITLNSETDKEYSDFVMKLILKVFNVKSQKNKVRSCKAINICVSRTDLVQFLIKNGLKKGNKLKQNLSIPDWITRKQIFLTACIRGMVDTDGSIVHEVHTIKGKKYSYNRLNFTSASPVLVQQVMCFFRDIGFHPKLRRRGRSVELENKIEIWEYFKRVGTHNPKHLNRLGGVAREV
jgi:hypothetical protein